MNNLDEEIIKLRNENTKLLEINADLEERLRKYTNNSSHRKYYESNKEKVQNIQKLYIEKLKTEKPEEYKEQRKESNKKYYEKKKIEKLKMK